MAEKVDPIPNGGYQEIIARLEALRTATPTPIPLIDPTANVLEAMRTGTLRQDDLRELIAKYEEKLRLQGERYQERLDDERRRADTDAKIAESKRIDALLSANTSNVALALDKQSAQAAEQARRLSVLEQNQYQTGGRDIQRADTRAQSNFSWAQFAAWAAVAVVAAAELHRNGVI